MSLARLPILLLLLSPLGAASAQDEAGNEATEAEAAAPAAPAARPQSRGEPSRSVSVGLTNAGSVAHGVELADTPSLFVKNGSTDTRWGTAELVAMVETAADAVASEHPGSRLTVGDLSRPHGGRAHPHRSHRAGRDVDIGFYVKDAESGDEVIVDRFINMSGSGRGRDQRGRQYRFDIVRNWALMASILADTRVDVQFVLINPSIRRTLIRHARESGVGADLLRRFSDVSARRSGSASHRSHFHVRIYCPIDDRPQCIDAPPFHPWIFTSEEEIQKRIVEWREYSPPRRARPRRRRRGRSRMRRARMGRRAMQSSMMRRSSMAERAGRASTDMDRTRMRRGASQMMGVVTTSSP